MFVCLFLYINHEKRVLYTSELYGIPVVLSFYSNFMKKRQKVFLNMIDQTNLLYLSFTGFDTFTGCKMTSQYFHWMQMTFRYFHWMQIAVLVLSLDTIILSPCLPSNICINTSFKLFSLNKFNFIDIFCCRSLHYISYYCSFYTVNNSLLYEINIMNE